MSRAGPLAAQAVLVLAVGAGLLACEGSNSGSPREMHQPGSPTSPPAAWKAGDMASWLEQPWSGSPSRVGRLHSRLPESPGPVVIAKAPFLHEEPIDAAIVAVGITPFGSPSPLDVGAIAVLDDRDRWRRVSLTDVGLRQPDNPEQQFALSPHGTVLALGDLRRVILLELADARPVAYEVPAREPVGLAWAPNGQAIVFFDRNRPVGSNAGWRLDLPTGELSRAMVPADAPVSDRSGSVIAYVKRRPGGIHPGMGVVVADPTLPTGSFLPLHRAQTRWTTVLGWTPAENVLVAVSDGKDGGILVWDPTALSLRRAVQLPVRGLIVSVAINILAAPER